MRKNTSLEKLIIAGTLVAACSIGFVQAGVDTVLVSGVIHTMDSDRTVVNALAIENGRIVKLGSNDDILKDADSNTRTIDLKGRTVIPGMIDSHTHIAIASDYTNACSLHEVYTKADIVEALKDCLVSYDGEGWLWGFGFKIERFNISDLNKDFLDEHFPDLPVAVVSLLHENTVVNSKGFHYMGFGQQPGDQDRKDYQRDEKGNLTGLGFGDSAVFRLRIFEETDDLDGLKAEVEKLNRLGITTFFDAGIFADNWPERMRKFKRLEDQGELTARTHLSVVPYFPDLDTRAEVLNKDIAVFEALRKELNSELIVLETLKVFVDIESPYMLESYEGTDYRGALATSQAAISAVVAAGAAHDASTFMHVIGDGAARAGLDAIASSATRQRKLNTPRNTLSHLMQVSRQDLVRFKEYDVVANVTPIWAFSEEVEGVEGDHSYGEYSIGEARQKREFRFKDMLESGVTISSSSDYPYSDPNPFLGMEVGITRLDPITHRGSPFNPDQALTLDTMVMSYTANGAYQLGRENDIGTLEVGKLADIAVLSQDIFNIPAKDISGTKVIMTLLGGDIVYESSGMGSDESRGYH